jgi:hypothetical protein
LLRLGLLARSARADDAPRRERLEQADEAGRDMSKRRQAGEWVRLIAGAGFCGDSARLKAEIQPEPWDGATPCFLCDEAACREWATLWTEPDPQANGKRHVLCHVSECEMEDV